MRSPTGRALLGNLIDQTLVRMGLDGLGLQVDEATTGRARGLATSDPSEPAGDVVGDAHAAQATEPSDLLVETLAERLTLEDWTRDPVNAANHAKIAGTNLSRSSNRAVMKGPMNGIEAIGIPGIMIPNRIQEIIIPIPAQGATIRIQAPLVQTMMSALTLR